MFTLFFKEEDTPHIFKLVVNKYVFYFNDRWQNFCILLPVI